MIRRIFFRILPGIQRLEQIYFKIDFANGEIFFMYLDRKETGFETRRLKRLLGVDDERSRNVGQSRAEGDFAGRYG